MGDTTIRPVTMMAQSAAGNGSSFGLDYRFGGMVQRTVVIASMNAADTITIQGSVDGGATWIAVAAPHTGGAGPFIDIITGPFTNLRVVKAGAGGTAVVQGLI